MSGLIFSIEDYKLGLKNGQYTPPEVLCPYYEVDPELYRKLGSTDQIRDNLNQAIDELRKRTDKTYFRNTYPLQAKTLDYSTRTFPAYQFILPEIMAKDWLAIVDWEKFHRDHVLHQPLCGYVLLKLLDGDNENEPLRLPNGQTFLDKFVEIILKWNETAYIRDFLLDCGMKNTDQLLDSKSPIARSVWKTFFREAAYIAAIFHDIGYPWHYVECMQENLDSISTSAIKQNKSAEQIFELFGHRLVFNALNGYQKIDAACPSIWRERIVQLTDLALTETHGFPGALGFLHLNDCVRKYPHVAQSPLHLLLVEWVAVAIMMHDMKKIYWGKDISESKNPENPFLRLSFKNDPLSSIITLVDIIQEFERPAVTYGTHGDSVTLNYKTACTHTEIEIDGNGVLTLRYQMESKEMRAIKRKSLANEKLYYFDNKYGYLNVSSIGINDVQFDVR